MARLIRKLRAPSGRIMPLSEAYLEAFWFGVGFRPIRQLPKIRGTVFWGPYNKDPTTYVGYYILRSLFLELS